MVSKFLYKFIKRAHSIITTSSTPAHARPSARRRGSGAAATRAAAAAAPAPAAAAPAAAPSTPAAAGKKDPLLKLVAGCVAGSIEATATWPLEYIKTRMQTMRKVPAKGGFVSVPQPYTSIYAGLRYTTEVKRTIIWTLLR